MSDEQQPSDGDVTVTRLGRVVRTTVDAATHISRRHRESHRKTKLAS